MTYYRICRNKGDTVYFIQCAYWKIGTWYLLKTHIGKHMFGPGGVHKIKRYFKTYAMAQAEIFKRMTKDRAYQESKDFRGEWK